MTPLDALACASRVDDQWLGALVVELLPVIRSEVIHDLRRRARLHGRDAQQEVDDLVQEVAIHLLSDRGRRLRRWDPARGRSLPSFVRLLTRHRLSRVFGVRRGHPWAGATSEDPEGLEEQACEPARAFEHTLSRQQLERLIDRLRARSSERSLRLLELIHVQQRPIPEVCRAMHMTRGAVDQWNVRLRRFARQLAAQLDRTPQTPGANLRYETRRRR
ncbi:MAG: hypothetical protein AAGF11_28385 [Myxococcota bacterium]